MSARWCDVCQESWPPGDALCPQCRATTALTRDRPRRTKEEAALALERYENRLKRAESFAAFADYYDKREERRIAEGHIAPEHLGKLDARRTAAMVRESEEIDKRLAA